MLKTLESYDQKQAEGILAKMALSLMPDPGVSSEGLLSTAQDSSIQAEVLKEVRKRLRLRDDEEFERAKGRVHELLAHELLEITFAAVDEAVVKKRVGQKGLLRSDLYDIGFSPFYKQHVPQFGIRESHVRETVRNPDQVQHLLHHEEGQFDAISIFLKAIPSSEPQSLLVLAVRKGSEQFVLNAFKVYHSDVDLSTAREPLDVWREFADVYGIDLTVGTEKSKFILYERIPAEGESEIRLVKAEARKTKQFTQTMMVRRNDDPPSFDVAIAFCLNVDRYKADLRRHGVPVTD